MDLYDAAKSGDEQAVRELLAAGAEPEAANEDGNLPIHVAALEGHVGVVHILLEAALATIAAINGGSWTPLHSAAYGGHTAVVRLLLEKVPATATAVAVSSTGRTPLHLAAFDGHTAVVQLLVEAAPATVTAVDRLRRTPLDSALNNGAEGLKAALCMVRAAPTVQPTLDSLARKGQLTATLYADLVSRLALTQQEWQSIPAPCPDLVRALPAVIERSEKEAGWLVGRLGQEQRARLRTGALCMGRVMAGVHGAPSLPAELSQRILVAALVEP